MDIKLEVLITETKTNIQIANNQGTIDIQETSDKKLSDDSACIYLLLKENQLISIQKAGDIKSAKLPDFHKIIAITPPWDIELDYFQQLFIVKATENGIALDSCSSELKILPENSKKTVSAYLEKVLTVLSTFGYPLKPQHEIAPVAAKTKPAKVRHKWTKEVSQIEFFIDTRESKATVLWHKRNEMLLKAGATLMKEPPLNKDGSLGFSAKFGEKIRDDYKDKISNFATTEDIILKSVNEVGLFLYFGGTNSWLELLDADGKSIDAWTRIDS